MRHRFAFIFFASVTILGCGQTTERREEGQIVDTVKEANKTTAVESKFFETIVSDLNNDSKPDTIILASPPETGDPGEFQKIILSINGFGRQSFSAKDVWDRVDGDFLTRNKNIVKSNNVFVFKNLDQTLILLFGFIYGSGRDEFSIIQIKNNKAQMIFDEHLEKPIQLADFNNDNKIELLGRNYGEMYLTVDSLHADIGVYHPFYVYSFENGCKINESLTKKYNEENYVWSGLKYSEEIKVLYPRDGRKPRIIK